MSVEAGQAATDKARAGSRERTIWSSVLVLSMLGILIAGYPTYVKVARVTPYCAGLGDCEVVNTGPYSEIAGIPVALLGLLAYIAIFGATIVVLRGLPWAEMATLVVFGLALTGTLFSAYLTYLELFVIGVICPWCVASAIVITLIYLLSIGPVRAAN